MTLTWSRPRRGSGDASWPQGRMWGQAVPGSQVRQVLRPQPKIQAQPAASRKERTQPHAFASGAVADVNTACRSGPLLQAEPSDSQVSSASLSNACFCTASLSGSSAYLLFKHGSRASGKLSRPSGDPPGLQRPRGNATSPAAARASHGEDFAYAFPTLSHLDSLFFNLEGEVKDSLAITDAASSVHCARLPRQSALEGRAAQPSAALPVQASQALCLLWPFSLTPGQSICLQSSLPKP